MQNSTFSALLNFKNTVNGNSQATFYFGMRLGFITVYQKSTILFN